jgi:hypothetical protein
MGQTGANMPTTMQVQTIGKWGWEQWAILSIPFALIALTLLVFVVFRGTLRTRLRVAMQFRDDPDVNDWLIIYDWSHKALYAPAAVMVAIDWRMLPADPTSQVIGGIWLGTFVLCFLIDEYQVSLKVLGSTVLLAVLVCLWLYQLGWLGRSFHALGRVSVSMSWMGFLFFGLLFSIGVVTSWIKGLFCYVAITPNYMNIQGGLTETAEQVSREDYTTRVDTGDFLERILGFGRIVITFRDSRRLPMMMLVGGIGKKTQALETIRGKVMVDTHSSPEGGQGGGVL